MIDCDASVTVCPVDAIYPLSEIPAELARYEKINAEYFQFQDHTRNNR
jgi:ferredoxin